MMGIQTLVEGDGAMPGVVVMWNKFRRYRAIGLSIVALLVGCGSATIFNPAFVNTFEGGVYPLTPGPRAPYVLVRVVNETTQNVEFVVTVEREVFQVDENGNIRFQDTNGNGQYDVGEPLVTEPLRETANLTTVPLGNANDIGVLFDCRGSIITRIGLGENLLPTDAAAFVGGQGAGGGVGFGVAATDVPALSYYENNFDCGDTVIFRAFVATGQAGGVGLQSLLLPGSEQPDSYSGADTFVTYDQFLESQIQEDE